VKSLRLFTAMVCFVAASAGATTFLPTTDRDLVKRSDAVVIGTVLGASTHIAANGYVMTDYDISVEESPKGFVARDITVRELGGSAGGRVTYVADSATYAVGEHVFLFLRHRKDGTWFTTSMALGKFTYSSDDQLLTRTVSELPRDAPRAAAAFRAYVRDVVGGVAAESSYFADPAVIGELGNDAGRDGIPILPGRHRYTSCDRAAAHPGRRKRGGVEVLHERDAGECLDIRDFDRKRDRSMDQ